MTGHATIAKTVAMGAVVLSCSAVAIPDPLIGDWRGAPEIGCPLDTSRSHKWLRVRENNIQMRGISCRPRSMEKTRNGSIALRLECDGGARLEMRLTFDVLSDPAGDLVISVTDELNPQSPPRHYTRCPRENANER